MTKLRVIVGSGAAAQVFRQTTDVQGYQTVVLGSDGLWGRVQGGVGQQHRMGQPPHLLQLPGQPVPPFQTADGKTTAGLRGFMTAGDFQQGIQALAQSSQQRDQAALLPQCRLVEITDQNAGQGQVRVKTSNPDMSFPADQVVMATGIGPQRVPAQAGIETLGEPAGGLGFQQILEGVDYLCSSDPTGKVVMVYGGGATSAWVAHEALRHAKQVVWLAREGGSGFSGSALPGNRNFAVLQKEIGARGTVNQIRYVKKCPISSVGKPRPMLRVRVTQDGGQKFYFVDQFLYALGGDPASTIGNLVAPTLLANLEPLRDGNRVLSDGSGVLAWGTPDHTVLVVGAAAFNMSAPGTGKQAAPMADLPRNAQVPDGIAMVNASITALNQHIPIKQDAQGNVTEGNVNLSTADRNQLAAFVATSYPSLPAEVANVAVEAIIQVRSSQEPGYEFGVSDEGVHRVVQEVVDIFAA